MNNIGKKVLVLNVSRIDRHQYMIAHDIVGSVNPLTGARYYFVSVDQPLALHGLEVDEVDYTDQAKFLISNNVVYKGIPVLARAQIRKS